MMSLVLLCLFCETRKDFREGGKVAEKGKGLKGFLHRFSVFESDLGQKVLPISVRQNGFEGVVCGES